MDREAVGQLHPRQFRRSAIVIARWHLLGIVERADGDIGVPRNVRIACGDDW